MKKVEKVSIANISFKLDHDAYLALKQYLDSLGRYYAADPDGREIIADIEARIAELILDEQVYTRVVSLALVDGIITQLGTPREIGIEADEADEADEFSTAAASAGSTGTAGAGSRSHGGAGHNTRGSGVGPGSDGTIPRRLHRNSEDKVLGGVSSGLAMFFDTNVVWIRLAFLFPIIMRVLILPFCWMDRCDLGDFFAGCAWVFIVTYIVLWAALPMARTPRQKLEARGEKITPSSIRQNLQGAVNTPSGRKAASVAAELFTVVGRVVLFLLKFVMAIVGFSLLFAALGIFICMGALLVDPYTLIEIEGMSLLLLFDGMSGLSPLMFSELVMLCALLPLMVIGMAMVAFTFNWRLRGLFFALTIGIWGAAMIFCGIVAMSNARFFHDEVPWRIEMWNKNHPADDSLFVRRKHREWNLGRSNGWRYEHSRVRMPGDSLGREIDHLNVDIKRDSLVIVVKSDGTPNDTIMVTRRNGTRRDRDTDRTRN
jgi:phage shock protein PspC (stress-responsive transcriptional regulator)